MSDAATRWASWTGAVGGFLDAATSWVAPTAAAQYRDGDEITTPSDWRGMLLGGLRTGVDWRAVSPPEHASIVLACLGYIARGITMMPLRVLDGDGNEATDHPALELLESPGTSYDGLLMVEQFVGGALLDGDAFLLIQRNAQTLPERLVWMPKRYMTAVRANRASWVTGWWYEGGEKPVEFPLDKLVWWRYALSHVNPLLARSPVDDIGHLTFLDQETGLFMSQSMRNAIGTGGVLKIDGDGETARKRHTQLAQQQGGDGRGRILVIPKEDEYSNEGWSPRDLDLRHLAALPQHRIPAMFGLNAIALGLDFTRAIFNNIREADQDAFEKGVLPVKAKLEQVLTRQWLWREFDSARTLPLRVRLVRGARPAGIAGRGPRARPRRLPRRRPHARRVPRSHRRRAVRRRGRTSCQVFATGAVLAGRDAAVDAGRGPARRAAPPACVAGERARGADAALPAACGGACAGAGG